MLAARLVQQSLATMVVAEPKTDVNNGVQESYTVHSAPGARNDESSTPHRLVKMDRTDPRSGDRTNHR